MFNELIKLYCYHYDLMRYYFWEYDGADWREHYLQNEVIMRAIERQLAALCE